MVLATWWGWSTVPSIALAIALAFFFGYLLTFSSVRRPAPRPGAAVRIALASDTVSILDHGGRRQRCSPGAAPRRDGGRRWRARLFWWSLAVVAGGRLRADRAGQPLDDRRAARATRWCTRCTATPPTPTTTPITDRGSLVEPGVGARGSRHGLAHGLARLEHRRGRPPGTCRHRGIARLEARVLASAGGRGLDTVSSRGSPGSTSEKCSLVEPPRRARGSRHGLAQGLARLDQREVFVGRDPASRTVSTRARPGSAGLTNEKCSLVETLVATGVSTRARPAARPARPAKGKSARRVYYPSMRMPRPLLALGVAPVLFLALACAPVDDSTATATDDPPRRPPPTAARQVPTRPRVPPTPCARPAR